MTFPFGKPIAAMICLSLISAVYILKPRPRENADLTVWVFADSHFRTYQPLVAKFEKQTGLKVSLNLVSNRALNLRLSSLFMSDPTSPEIPDLVEIEIGSIGQYFRPP